MSSSADSRVRAAGAPVRSPHPRGPGGVTVLRLALWLVCAALVLVPLTVIGLLALSANRLPLLLEGDVLEAARNSIVSALLSAAGAVAVGTALALLVERTDLGGRTALRLLALSPLLVPPFVGAIAWIGLAGPASTVNQAWTRLTGGPLWVVYGGDGVVFLLVVHSVPIAYLVVTAALRRVPSDLEQAARTSGASPWRTLRDVTLPLLRPALLSSFTLVAVSNLADFGIPSIVGLPDGYVTLSTLVYRYIQSGTVDAPLEVVATVGLVLLVLAGMALLVDVLSDRSRWELEASATAPLRISLGRARSATPVVTWLLVAAVTVLPLGALATQALLPAPGVPLSWGNLTLDSVVRAVTAPTTVTGLVNSVWLSLTAGVLCAALGLAVATLVTRTRSRDNAALRGVAMLPLAVPGLVIAVGWLVLAPRIGLFNTPWLILCAYVTAFVALVVQTVAAPLRATPLTAEEAARVAGASRLRALGDISFRMALPAALTGGVLVVLTAGRELTISALLLSPGSQTLGVAIFNLQQAGAYNAASALSLIVTLVGLAGLRLAARQAR